MCNSTIGFGSEAADGEGKGGRLPPPIPTFLQMVIFFYMRTPGIPNQKSQADADMQQIKKLDIAFNLFNIFLYVIARKVRKCPLSPFVTSNVVLSCLVRMADILARLVQMPDSLSALQLMYESNPRVPIPPG